MTQISFLHPTPAVPVMAEKRTTLHTGGGCDRMALRPYQEEAKTAILQQWRSGVRRTLLVLVTGGGKTIIFSKVIEELVRKGERVLVLAHRGELLDQAADKLEKTTGLKCATEKAERSCLDDSDQRWYRVVVGSVQSLMRPQRL